jgi:hypothetical protein
MVGLGCLGGGSDHHRETDSGIERLSSAGGGRPGGSAAPPPGGNSRVFFYIHCTKCRLVLFDPLGKIVSKIWPQILSAIRLKVSSQQIRSA